MESVPALAKSVNIDKENETAGGMNDAHANTLGSPMTVLKAKKSLSILSGNDVAKRGQLKDATPKSARQRIISESTGLVKFALKSPAKIDSIDEQQSVQEEMTSGGGVANGKKNGLPIYIPVNPHSPIQTKFSDQIANPFLSPENKSSNNRESSGEFKMNFEEELLYRYAKKQREVLELKTRLEYAEKDLKDLEKQMASTNLRSSGKQLEQQSQQNVSSGSISNNQANKNQAGKLLNFTSPMVEIRRKFQESTLSHNINNNNLNNTNNPSELGAGAGAGAGLGGATPIRQAIRSKVSMLNFANNLNKEVKQNTTTLNKKPSMMKFKQDFNEMSNNFISDGKKFQNEFLSKSRQFIDNFQTLTSVPPLPPLPAEYAHYQEQEGETKRLSRDEQHVDDEYMFQDRSQYSNTGDLTYSSDGDDEIENLEGGKVVPFEF